MVVVAKAKLKQKTKPSQKASVNTDGDYLLKLVICLILGCIWVKIGSPDAWQIPVPVGLIAGLILIRKDKLKIDKKIEYAVLLIAMLIGFWANTGIFVSI